MITPILLHILSLLHRLLPHLPIRLSSHIHALLCLLHLGLNLPFPLPLHSTLQTLTISNRKIETHVISTSTHPSTTHTRTVLIIHGLAPSAHNDPRILHLARSVAAAQPSTLVLVPHIPQLADCDLADAPVAFIQSLIQHISSNTALSPTGTLSIVSPCISAGFCLVASSRLPYSVHSILAIGSHSSVKTVMHHVIDRGARDDSKYAGNSLLASFLTPRTPLRDLLVAYVFDDHYRNIGKPADSLVTLLAKYPEEAETYHRLQNDPPYLEHQLRKAYAENEDVMLGMSPIEHLHRLRIKTLVLVHSETDDVVPSHESVILRDALNDRKDIHTRLCITSLLNHGDQRALAVKDVPSIFQLVSAFAGFFLPERPFGSPQCKDE